MKSLGQTNFALQTRISSGKNIQKKKLEKSELEEIILFKIIWSSAVNPMQSYGGHR